MLTFAFLFVSQTVSADGSLGNVYIKSVQLAERTYQQSADAWNGKAANQIQGAAETDGGSVNANSEGGK
jgi:hypothetical protein